MNLDKLKKAEAIVLKQYPGGFNHPEMVEIGKKHKMEKMIELAHELFSEEELKKGAPASENMIKMVTRSSMVSVFEKPKFRDCVREMLPQTKGALVSSLYELLHGDEEKGFNDMVELLAEYKLAKWPLLTVYGAYYRPKVEVFCKPTTVKGIVATYELEGITYKPRPSYEFYKKYRSYINKMKKHVDKSFTTSNAAFSGFLMMTLG